MEVRKATTDDWPQVQKLHSLVYNSPRTDFEVTDDDTPSIEHTWCIGDPGHPISVMISHEFMMIHDGAYVPMAGIGGVGTLPEHRRRGHVRRMFDSVFADMRERGQVFSTLYPFSFPYYRMFGYELAYSRNEYVLPLDAIDVRGRRGSIEQVIDATPEICTVYDKYVARRNLSIQRTPRLWARRMRIDPYKDQVFTYLYRDDSGTARGFFTFKVESAGDSGRQASVRDMAFERDSDLVDLLSHLSVLYPGMKRVLLRLPSDVPLDVLVPEPYELEQSRSAVLMARIVDAPRVLEATRWPGEGELVIAISDEMMSWNDSTFLVEWGDRACRVLETSRSPDITIGIRPLAQLLCGYLDGGTALSFRLLTSDLPCDTLRSLFPSKPLYQNDGF